MKRPASIVLTREHLRHVVAQYSQFDAFAFDVETRGTREPRDADDKPALDVMTNEVIWVSLAGPGVAHSIPVGHRLGEELTPLTKVKEPWYDETQPTKSGRGKKKWRTVTIPPTYADPPKQLWRGEVFETLEPLLFSERIKIAHKIKFDLESVAKYYDWEVPTQPYFCTLTAHRICNENIPATKLKQLVERYFGFEYESIGKMINDVPFSQAARYARLDSRYDWLLYLKLSRSIKKQRLENVLRLDMDVIGALCRSELEGATIDLPQHRKLKDSLEADIEELKGKLYKIAGRQWDVYSQPQQGWFVYEVREHPVKELTKGGKTGLNKKPSTAEATLEKIANKDPAVQTLMDLKEVHKLYSTYVDGIGRKITPEGRVHAEFTVWVAVTGRLSCNSPNLHNIPRPGSPNATAIRGMFIAPPEHKLIVADYAQQEYRVLAHFSQDPRYLEIFLKGDEDPHVLTAIELGFADHPDDVSKKDRDTSKNTGFAVVYGAGPDKVAVMSGVTITRAKEVMNRHQKTFPGIYKWIEHTKREARTRKPPYVETLFGRRRRLPAMYAQDRGARGAAERQAVNSRIQGTAAEITKMAIVRLDMMLEEGMHQTLNVHDELVMTVPSDRVERGLGIVREAMAGEAMQVLSVPLTVDPVAVDRWSDAK